MKPYQSFGLTTSVKDGNIEKALRKLKKKVNNDGRLAEAKARKDFTKPTEERKIAKAAAVKRWQKKLAKSQPKGR